MFRLEQLAYLVATAEKGSLNKAAKALYLSQPALSKQLALLEKQLGCRLFHRKRTGIELTEAGRYLYERASLILEQVEETVAGIKRFSEQQRLRIGALPSVANHYLPERVAAYTAGEAGKVALVVKDTSEELTALLEEGMVDAVLVQNRAGDAPFLTRPLLHESYLAVLPADHPLAEKEAVDFAAFCCEPLLIHRDPCDIREDFRRQCRRLGVQAAHLLELDFNDSLLAYAAMGNGLTIVPEMAAASLGDKGLAVRPFRQPFGRTISLICHPEAVCEAVRLCEEETGEPSSPRSAE
ncbi:LysR family transcriptional regulator [Brevibacillus sp. WF146]|uniref:LysR family transcriptional regulator n=1 Tax=Brevibacillus sp. WF146 TaxID=319501 RepID=UPI0022274EA0|nr:LysR family transcriptional regulator [Brevibacillus sp. WF146]UYZ13321.1 LysR family transcriptional regulator [Brevibacillus sp. WF146]